MRDELWPTIGDDIFGDAIIAEYMVKQGFDGFQGGGEAFEGN